MDFGLLRGKLAGDHVPSVLPLRKPGSENAQPAGNAGEDAKAFSERTRRKLWIVLAFDIVTVPWMLAFGSWFDETSKLTSVFTLGGHHKLVMIMAIVGFGLLAVLAILTDGFTATHMLHRALTIVACLISMTALAGALSVLVLFAVAWLALGVPMLIRK